MFFVSSLLFMTGWKIAAMKQELEAEKEVLQQQVDEFVDESNAIIKIQERTWNKNKEGLLAGVDAEKKQELTNFVENVLLCKRLNPDDYMLEDHGRTAR